MESFLKKGLANHIIILYIYIHENYRSYRKAQIGRNLRGHLDQPCIVYDKSRA